MFEIHEFQELLETHGWECEVEQSLFSYFPSQKLGGDRIEEVTLLLGERGVRIEVLTSLYFEDDDNEERGKFFERMGKYLGFYSMYIDGDADGQLVFKIEPTLIGNLTTEQMVERLSEVAATAIDVADRMYPILEGLGTTITARAALEYLEQGDVREGNA